MNDRLEAFQQSNLGYGELVRTMLRVAEMAAEERRLLRKQREELEQDRLVLACSALTINP